MLGGNAGLRNKVEALFQDSPPAPGPGTQYDDWFKDKQKELAKVLLKGGMMMAAQELAHTKYKRPVQRCFADDGGRYLTKLMGSLVLPFVVDGSGARVGAVLPHDHPEGFFALTDASYYGFQPYSTGYGSAPPVASAPASDYKAVFGQNIPRPTVDPFGALPLERGKATNPNVDAAFSAAALNLRFVIRGMLCPSIPPGGTTGTDTRACSGCGGASGGTGSAPRGIDEDDYGMAIPGEHSGVGGTVPPDHDCRVRTKNEIPMALLLRQH
jgi:hypothetical protein